MKVGILQPGYLPWLGFFEQLAHCDIFVYLDDVQYTKSDWRNRNRIKTKDGAQWLTVPVSYEFGQNINEVSINNDHSWRRKHLQAFQTWYGKSPFFGKYYERFRELLSIEWIKLADLDIKFIQLLIVELGLNVKTVRSSELSLDMEDRQYRLVQICENLGSDCFYEGKSGQGYIDTELFKAQGINVEFQEYKHPYYNQLWLKEQGFISHLSVIDLLFNHGPESLAILTGKKVIAAPENVKVRHANDV